MVRRGRFAITLRVPTLWFEMTVAAPIEKVWAFFNDPVRNLPALSPPGADATIVSADIPVREGSRITLTARGPLGMRLRWVARIIELRPPHPVVFGQEARFVDVQESGPFAAWRHEHEFEAVDACTTRIVDRITYRVRGGPAGWLIDLLVVRRQLRAMFRHRHTVTGKLLA